VLVVGVGGGCLTVSSGLSFFVKVFAVSATGIATGLVLSVCTFDEMVGDFECNPICRREAGWAVSMLGSRTPDEAQSSEYSVGMNSWGFVGTFRPFRPLASFRRTTPVSAQPRQRHWHPELPVNTWLLRQEFMKTRNKSAKDWRLLNAPISPCFVPLVIPVILCIESLKARAHAKQILWQIFLCHM